MQSRTWHNLSKSHRFWKRFVIWQWNLPLCFESCLSEKDCKLICLEWIHKNRFLAPEKVSSMPYLVYSSEERNPSSSSISSSSATPSLSSSKPNYTAKNLWDGTPFLNYFTELMKTYCGGGEFENCIFSRFFIREKHQDKNRLKDETSACQKPNTRSDSLLMTPEKGSIFCHLNIANLNSLDEISRLEERDPKSYSQEERWLISLYRETRSLYHRSLF